MYINEKVQRVITTGIGIAFTIGLSWYVTKKLTEALDPTQKSKEENKKKALKLMKAIGVPNVELEDYELVMASNLMNTNEIEVEWEDIGGLDDVVKDIRESVIEPLKHPDLFKTPLSQPPKGVLLYGPPGCGKTMIAKATAKAAGARFLNLNITSLFDKWYGESQKRTDAVFSLARKIQPTIIFIDEIDSFLRERSSSDHESTSLMKTQFMSLWDGLSTHHHSLTRTTTPTAQPLVVIMAATNRPKDVDDAILRRMPAMFHISLPDQEQRTEILRKLLKQEVVSEGLSMDALAGKTGGWSGSDLKELCRSVVVSRTQEVIRERELLSKRGIEVQEAQMKPAEERDFDLALKKMIHFKDVSNNSFQSSN